jgi:hypothetical protein
MTLPHRDELIGIVRQVRRRWRWKVVLRCLVVLAAAGVGTVLVAAYGLEQFRFSPASIVVARVVTYLAFAGLGWAFFVRPLARHVTDQQVALYLEEHEPSFDQLLVSAVDAGSSDRPPDRSGESMALLTRMIETAIARCQEADLGRRIERSSLRRSAAALGAIGIVTAIVFGVGPAYLRQGAMAVLVPVSGVEAASPYRIDVTPGDTTVARGADVQIVARLSGFSAADVDLYTRSSTGAPFERALMVAMPVPSDPRPDGAGGPAAVADEGGGVFESMLFGVRVSTEYFVQAAGVRSAVFTIEAADLPYADRLQLEYVYPAYTGLAPAIVEEGGDIAVVKGTTVRLRAHSTLATSGGRVVRDDRDHVALSVLPDGELAGEFPVTKDGLYRLEFVTAAGTFVVASPQYTVDALEDDPPVVSLSKPARDLRATSIDEVYVEASADDDFGVATLDLVVAVNGGPEKVHRLAGPPARAMKALTAGHTFFLEELGLQPGDVVSYYARGADNNAVGGAKASTSDIFFVQIQPFRKDYRAAESQAGGQPPGGGQGGGNDASALSEQQRRIVSGTFNLVRDREKVGPDKFRQDAVFLALAQGQLKDRAKALASQILERVANADPLMKTIAGHLGDAAVAMETAERQLQGRDPKAALPAEQQALASLQRAEEAYRDVRVRMEQQRGGGGGGGQASSGAADELADLFQLEMDKLRNQYETFQRSQQQTGDNKVDEMLERLKELARRQEQEAERQRQAGGARQQGASAAGARQRQLADDTEEAARQLERLSREEGRQDLAQTARGLREAAETMRRAAASGDASAFAQAREAAERLGQARDRLDRQRADRMARSIDEALSRLDRVARMQDEIAADVRDLAAPGSARREQVQRLNERKDVQASEVTNLERDLDRTASDFRRERQQAARKVQETADAIRESRLRDKIRYSKGVVQNAPAETAAEFEAQIASDIAEARERLQAAAGAVGQREQDGRAEALDRARGLVRGVESLGRRLQGAQAGRDNAGAPAGGRSGVPAGSGNPPSGAGSEPPDGSQPGGDPRQFQREAGERRAEAEALRRDLRAMGVDAGELDALIGRMRAMEAQRVLADPDEAVRLQGQLVEGFRRFEFDMRRRLGATVGEQLFLSGSDDAPAGYRKAIEEYYRALARERRPTGVRP